MSVDDDAAGVSTGSACIFHVSYTRGQRRVLIGHDRCVIGRLLLVSSPIEHESQPKGDAAFAFKMCPASAPLDGDVKFDEHCGLPSRRCLDDADLRGDPVASRVLRSLRDLEWQGGWSLLRSATPRALTCLGEFRIQGQSRRWLSVGWASEVRLPCGPVFPPSPFCLSGELTISAEVSPSITSAGIERTRFACAFVARFTWSSSVAAGPVSRLGLCCVHLCLSVEAEGYESVFTRR